MSYRMVRTEQIGPSGHKNEYHIGVLHGNWQEERFALGRKAQGKLKFEGESEARGQFIPRFENGSVIAKPERMFPSECPRELLFGQGPATSTANADQQWLTTSQLRELSISTTKGGNNSRTGGGNLSAEDMGKLAALNSSRGAARAAAALTKPQKVDDDDGDDFEQFKTTKQSTHDTTATRILTGEVNIPQRTVRARGGNITNEIKKASNTMGLRK